MNNWKQEMLQTTAGRFNVGGSHFRHIPVTWHKTNPGTNNKGKTVNVGCVHIHHIYSPNQRNNIKQINQQLI